MLEYGTLWSPIPIAQKIHKIIGLHSRDFFRYCRRLNRGQRTSSKKDPVKIPKKICDTGEPYSKISPLCNLWCSRVEKVKIPLIAGNKICLFKGGEIENSVHCREKFSFAKQLTWQVFLSDVQGYINWQFCSLQGTSERRRYFWTLLLLTASSPYFQWQVRSNPALNQIVKCKSLVLLLTIPQWLMTNI